MIYGEVATVGESGDTLTPHLIVRDMWYMYSNSQEEEYQDM